VRRRLGVCLDALPALRDAISGGAPELRAAATLLELAGADAVQLGVTEDLRPVTESDLRDGAQGGLLELRLAPAPSLVKVALEARPRRVVLASESRENGTRPLPLDFRAWGGALAPAVRSLREAGLRVEALVAPDLEAVKAAHAADLQGVDLFTGGTVDLPPEPCEAALVALGDAARLASKLRMRVGVAGGLGLRDLPTVLDAAPVVESVTVGRSFAARAFLLGIERALADFRAVV
jgi:pyridoxine 5'-phosphate synthase PdxJ